jgi:hypothetical protein
LDLRFPTNPSTNLQLLVASGLRFVLTTAHLFNVDLIDAVVGLPRRCWGLSSVTLGGNLQGTSMNQFVASCLASGAVAHWLILLSVVQLTRG